MQNNIKPHILEIARIISEGVQKYVKDRFFMFLYISLHRSLTKCTPTQTAKRPKTPNWFFSPFFKMEINRFFLCYLFICEESLYTKIIKQVLLHFKIKIRSFNHNATLKNTKVIWALGIKLDSQSNTESWVISLWLAT